MFDYPKNKDIVFVDIEANDKPKRLLQFGAVKLKTNGEIEEVNWFSNPKCNISKYVKEIVKNNYENILNGENSIKILKRIKRFVSDCVFVSYSPFDYIFLNKLCRKIFKKDLNCTFIDLQEEWKKFTCIRNAWSLKKLGNFFGINMNEEQWHDALYDAKILFSIFTKWRESEKDDVILSVYRDRFENQSQIKPDHNFKKSNSLVLNNLDYTNGYTFLNMSFRTLNSDDNLKKEWILADLNVIQVQNNVIKKNFSFNYEINESFDFDDYYIQLIKVLKKYLLAIKHKKIVILDNKFGDLIKISNLCSKYLKAFPLNNIIFSNGFDNFFEFIDMHNYRFQPNIYLIKQWLALKYIKQKLLLETK